MFYQLPPQKWTSAAGRFESTECCLNTTPLHPLGLQPSLRGAHHWRLVVIWHSEQHVQRRGNLESVTTSLSVSNPWPLGTCMSTPLETLSQIIFCVTSFPSRMVKFKQIAIITSHPVFFLSLPWSCLHSCIFSSWAIQRTPISQYNTQIGWRIGISALYSHSRTQVLSILRLLIPGVLFVQPVDSSKQEFWELHERDLWAIPRADLFHFCLYSIGQNSVMWSYLTARDSKKHSVIIGPGEKRNGAW